MGPDGAIAIVSSVCGVVTAVISNPWGGRRWQRVVVDELSLYSTMRHSADSPREMAVATLLRKDAFGRALKGLGYRMSGGVPVKTDWHIVRSGILSFCGTFAVDTLLTIAAYGDVLGRILNIAGTALVSTVLYLIPYIIGPHWPKKKRNNLYSRAVENRRLAEKHWHLLLIDSEMTMLGDELASIIDELTDEPLSHADSVHIEQIRERISELREEADAELNPHSVSRTSR